MLIKWFEVMKDVRTTTFSSKRVIAILSIGLFFILSTSVYAQRCYRKTKWWTPTKQCKMLYKKMKPEKAPIITIFNKKSAPENMRIGAAAPHVIKPAEVKEVAMAKPKPIEYKESIQYNENLPEAYNDKHAEIRQQVAEKIKSGNAEESMVESLYFITDQDEFAYLDFDAFFIAVEYALQGKMILVEGHTDNRGDDEYNLQLSMKRVRQIERLMIDIGVSQDQISVIGYGETMPKYDNNTEDGRQKNRRVDFKIF